MSMNKNAIHWALMGPLEVEHAVRLQWLVSRATLTFFSCDFFVTMQCATNSEALLANFIK